MILRLQCILIAGGSRKNPIHNELNLNMQSLSQATAVKMIMLIIAYSNSTHCEIDFYDQSINQNINVNCLGFYF